MVVTKTTINKGFINRRFSLILDVCIHCCRMATCTNKRFSTQQNERLLLSVVVVDTPCLCVSYDGTTSTTIPTLPVDIKNRKGLSILRAARLLTLTTLLPASICGGTVAVPWFVANSRFLAVDPKPVFWMPRLVGVLANRSKFKR